MSNQSLLERISFLSSLYLKLGLTDNLNVPDDRTPQESFAKMGKNLHCVSGSISLVDDNNHMTYNGPFSCEIAPLLWM